MNIDKDLTSQAVKLLYYFYGRYNIDKYATNVDKSTFKEDFISIATLYCLNKIHNYDPKRGEFSTFIYMMFSCNLYIWINMANYGHSYSEARALYKVQKGQKKESNTIDHLYASTPIIPYSYDSIIDKNGSELNFTDLIADPDINLESDVLDKLSHNEILKSIRTTNTLSKSQKKYLLLYLEQKLTMQEIADIFKVSRQTVGQAIKQASKRLQKTEFIRQCCNK